MDAVAMHHLPALTQPLLIAAFTGWPDSGEVASATARYLVRKLRARSFASLDPEQFHDFTQQRPHVAAASGDEQVLAWPAGEFWAAPAENGGRDLVIFVGPEPQLRWRTYAETLLSVARQVGVTEVAALGCVYDNVPHTGASRLTGVATEPDVLRRLESAGLLAADFAGTSSIHPVLLEHCEKAGIAAAGIWGHAPHYVQAIPNWKVCYAILRKLHRLYGVCVDLDAIRSAGRTVERRIERTLDRDPELRAYVQQIQQRTPPSPGPSALAPEWDLADILIRVEELLWPHGPDAAHTPERE